MSEAIPELYDVDRAMAELTRARRRRDEVTRQQALVGDKLALHIDRHLSAEELETAGRVLVIAAGGIGTLAEDGLPPAVLVNVIAFAGARLIRDGRDA